MDKIKEIAAVTIESHTTRRNIKPSELGDEIAYQSPALTIADDIAKQIADLYNPPEDFKILIEERTKNCVGANYASIKENLEWLVLRAIAYTEAECKKKIRHAIEHAEDVEREGIKQEYETEIIPKKIGKIFGAFRKFVGAQYHYKTQPEGNRCICNGCTIGKQLEILEAEFLGGE